jgi:hypothetical protein
MLRQVEEGDTKGGFIIPNDMFVEFQKKWGEGINERSRNVSRMLEHDFRAGDSCAQKNEKYIYETLHKICWG